MIKTKISGVLIIESAPQSDERGGFARIVCKKTFAQAGLNADFAQINQSFNTHAGTFRGFHYQLPPAAESKLVRCIVGKIYDIVIDLRHGSPTLRQWIGVELDAQKGRMLYIPDGCAHGFITLSDNTQLIYHHTGYYVPELEAGIAFNDPGIGVVLPRDIAVISERDRRHPFLPQDFTGIAPEARHP